MRRKLFVVWMVGVSLIGSSLFHDVAPASAATTKSAAKATKVKKAVKIATAQKGKPYVWGATGPNSFDCSGLVVWAYGKAGIKIKQRTTMDQIDKMKRVSKPKVGDLVFFGPYNNPDHVGIYIGKGKMVHAPNSRRPVSIDKVTSQDRRAMYARV